MRQFDAIVFDLDGTLVDSRLDFAALRRQLGFPVDVGVLEHLETLADADRTRAQAVIDRYECAQAAVATWIDGAQTVLEHLHRQGVPVAILTRNSRAAVRATEAALDLSVDLILTREDCAPKPDPEGLWRIADELGLLPPRMLYVGDFIYDLQAARNAGLVAALYLNGRNDHFRDQADILVSHLHDLLRWTGRGVGNPVSADR